MKSHSYIPRRVKILKREELTDDVVALRLKLLDRQGFSFHPGQFVMLSVLGYGEIPIGLTSDPSEKGYLEVAVRTTGLVSQKIWELPAGAELGLNGPFGNGFPLSRIKGKDVVLVSGGIGLAPLRSLIEHLLKNPKLVKSFTLLYGAKCPGKLLYQQEYAAWEKLGRVLVSVDNNDCGWQGHEGQITSLYEHAGIKPGSTMIVCGPPPMFNSVIQRYAGKRVAENDLYFLLERRMKCGVGKCQHCTCGKEYVCLDGPVFSFKRSKNNVEAFS